MKTVALLSIVCACALALTCACSAPVAASDYFPDVLSCGSSPDQLVPPPEVLAQGAPAPPVPLFAELFRSLAESAIAAKWLPDRFDDAVYLEHGEGAYRAHTAHLCKLFQRSGGTVVLKGFAGRLVAIVAPMPVKITPEARQALLEAAKLPLEPCSGVSPYEEEGAPAAVAALFVSLRDELVSPAAQPASAEHWDRMLKGIWVGRGGLTLSYSAKGPIDDPAVDPAIAAMSSNYSVRICTNGDALTVSLDRNNIVKDNLYRQLQPIVDMPTDGLHIPYVSRMATVREWVAVGEVVQEGVIPRDDLVATQQQATHQKLYFDLGNGLKWMGLLPAPASAVQVEEAAWLCLARSCVGGIAGNAYPYWINHQGNASASEVLQRLRETRAKHLAVLTRLEEAPCPQALADVRESLLSALGVSKAIWDAAVPRWESALSSVSGSAVDWEAIRSSVNEEIASKGLPAPPVGWNWGDCWETIRSAETALGIRTEEALYGP